MTRTRIKICGLTRAQDVQAGVAAGVDALGFVFYPASPRAVDARAAAALVQLLPPFVSAVGLFVNATPEQLRAVTNSVPLALLQFHGDESAEQCAELAALAGRPFMRACRVKSDTSGADLLEYERQYRCASSLFSGLLLDTHVESYGGAGKVFDWSVIPKELAPRVVLSGGLSVANATEAVLRVRPYGVDISSGVELQKGIKDARQIAAFVARVRAADATIQRETDHDQPS
ncbi:MAG: phosphoribosylanthranilate isomerase [Pseudomonadota bacterium]